VIAEVKKLPPVEDIRAGRPYLLGRHPLTTLLRRTVSIAVLVAIDLAGLTIGLYAALTLRSLVRDPRPILWNLLWVEENDWLPFLILLLLLVFWRNRLYGARELREGAGRIVPSVFLVAALTLAFAIGTDQHFVTFGLYVVAALLTAFLISVFRWSYETLTGSMMRSLGVRRRVLLVGDEEQVAHLRATASTTTSPAPNGPARASTPRSPASSTTS
jgi:FlaA1/EpsC-like NDP-sugar epimerase